MDSLHFVQFIHPGIEHEPEGGKNIKNWNTHLHRRKFIVNPGRYVGENENNTIEDTLCFWGEWEPQSEVIKVIESPQPGMPRYFYKPYYDITEIACHSTKPKNNYQNTDPFVFGEQFHYTCCQQSKGGIPTKMQSLDKGSVILFGSCIKKKEFVLDTVFVVDHWIDFSLKCDLESLKKHISRTYGEVTIDRLSNESLRLYFGATFKNPVEGMYSFFPCSTWDKCPNGFKRPSITINDIITQKLPQGVKGIGNPLTGGIIKAKELWDEVVKQVKEVHNLKLGIFTELPPSRH